MNQSETTSAAGGVAAEPSEAALHAAMDAFYPGEDWRTALGGALDTSLRDMRAALSAAALAAPTAKGGTEVPAGWKLVPVHPTMAMIGAGRRWEEGTTSAWSAMLEDSPPPPAGAAGGGSGDLGALSEHQHSVAKAASERAAKNAKVAPELLFAPILWAIQEAEPSPTPDLGAQGEPVGWLYERATYSHVDGDTGGWDRPQFSFERPNFHPRWVRNIRALYAEPVPSERLVSDLDQGGPDA